LETLRDLAQVEMGQHRDSRRAISRAQTLLQKALPPLEKALDRYPSELEMIENYWYRAQRGKFAETVQFLRDALEIAKELASAYAAAVHPQLRGRKTEQRLAQELLTEHRTDPFFPAEFPARKRSPDIDHWFISTAKACLDAFPIATGRKTYRYDIIIEQLFEIAFHDHSRSEENIRTELRRPAPADFLGLSAKLFEGENRARQPRSNPTPSHHPLSPTFWTKNSPTLKIRPEIVRTKSG
jgi:hypothetical protein